jgi:hypothetical protein
VNRPAPWVVKPLGGGGTIEHDEVRQVESMTRPVSGSIHEADRSVKYFLSALVLAVVLGTVGGWATNYARYGHRTARFGPITADGAVTAANAMAKLQERLPQGLAKVELIGDPSHDFGVMAPDEEGEHAFRIKNVGDETLRLRIGASSCKCTIGTLAADSLEPGEETDVTLSWTVKTDSSEFSQSAQLLTNDPENVAINLSVSGRVVRQMEMVPKTWTFGEVASGQTITLASKVYNYMDYDITPTELRFSSEEMTALSDFHVEAYSPNEEQDGVHAEARQAFAVEVQIRPGMRQGPVSQNFLFGFQQVAGSSSPKDLDNQAARTDDRDDVAEGADGSDGQPQVGVLTAATTGRIIGALSMIPNPKLTGRDGSGYVYDFGRLDASDPMTAKAYIVLKGPERENTNLSVGDVSPQGVIEASLGQPLKKASMSLFPLSMKLKPGDKPIARLGANRNDFGVVRINTDNPKVPSMRIGIKFAIPARLSP